MKQFIKLTIPALFVVLPLSAQDIKMPPGLDKLEAKASEVVNVSLDGALLQLGARFLSDQDSDEAHVKKLIGGLKGIYVKSFEFDEKNQYSQSDVEEFRAQLKPPTWNRIVGASSKRKGENSEVYIKTDGGQILGLAVIVTDPKELTIVNIVGSMRPEDLRNLGGHMGIPRLDVGGAKNKDKKDQDEDDK